MALSFLPYDTIQLLPPPRTVLLRRDRNMRMQLSYCSGAKATIWTDGHFLNTEPNIPKH